MGNFNRIKKLKIKKCLTSKWILFAFFAEPKVITKLIGKEFLFLIAFWLFQGCSRNRNLLLYARICYFIKLYSKVLIHELSGFTSSAYLQILHWIYNSSISYSSE